MVPSKAILNSECTNYYHLPKIPKISITRIIESDTINEYEKLLNQQKKYSMFITLDITLYLTRYEMKKLLFLFALECSSNILNLSNHSYSFALYLHPC